MTFSSDLYTAPTLSGTSLLMEILQGALLISALISSRSSWETAGVALWREFVWVLSNTFLAL
jgi:hypothetical protein